MPQPTIAEDGASHRPGGFACHAEATAPPRRGAPAGCVPLATWPAPPHPSPRRRRVPWPAPARSRQPTQAGPGVARHPGEESAIHRRNCRQVY